MSVDSNEKGFPAQSRLGSGIEGLDVILEGGFLEGGIYIVQGRPGTGKTIFGNQICFNHAARGGNALYVTLLAENHSRMMMHLSSLAFFDSKVIPQRLYYISAFTALEQDSLGGLIKLIRQEAVRHGAQVIVLDGLVAAERRATSDVEFKKFIHELQFQAALLNCTMFLLTSAGSEHVSAEHTMVDGVLELHYALQGWRTERHLRVVKRRGADFLPGLHAFDITSAGMVVFPRIEMLTSRYAVAHQRTPGPALTSGVPSLDRMMGGGIPACSTTLLLGSSGVGKTTLGLQFLSQCNAREPGILCGFYETPAAIDVKAQSLELEVAELIGNGIVQVLWRPTTDGSIDAICSQLLAAVQAHGAKRVFIDGLEALQKLAIDPSRVSQILTSLTMQLERAGVTTVYTAEIEGLVSETEGEMLSGVSTAGVSAIAENILGMRFIEANAQLHRALSVIKVRDARVDGRLHLFEIAEGGLRIDDSHERAAAIMSVLGRKAAASQLRRPQVASSSDAPED